MNKPKLNFDSYLAFPIIILVLSGCIYGFYKFSTVINELVKSIVMGRF